MLKFAVEKGRSWVFDTMKSVSEINLVLQRHLDQLRQEFHVAQIGVFGSTVMGEHNTESDIDILVEFLHPIGFVGFIRLENHLKRILGTNIDLVSRKALKPHIGRRILEEVQYVT